MKVFPISLFKDNYAYAILNHMAKETYLVDPSDFEAVEKFLEKVPYKLTHVLSTHKHWDHSRDNQKFAEKYPEIQILGGVLDNIPAVNLPLQHNAELTIGGHVLKVIHTPCHTKGHVMYYYNNYLFTGDTLFVGGCGRFFEGTAADMWNNFAEVKKLPKDTEIYCGHEYTLANLQWAAGIWQNKDLDMEIKMCIEKRKNGEPTVPSTVEKEKLINIFMNADKLVGQLGCKDHIEALGKLRELKNRNAFV